MNGVENKKKRSSDVIMVRKPNNHNTRMVGRHCFAVDDIAKMHDVEAALREQRRRGLPAAFPLHGRWYGRRCRRAVVQEAGSTST